MADEKKLVTIQTPSGEVTFRESTIPNRKDFGDTITALTPDESVALELDANRASAFIAAFVLPHRRTGDTLEDLDSAFSEWLPSGRREAFTSSDVIRIIGCVLGTQAVQQLGVRWMHVTDAHGSDIALVAEHPPTRSFPFTSIQYRIEDNETHCVVALYRTLAHLMNSVPK